MTEVGLGARGVFVEWTGGGFAYRHNPKPSAASGPWRDVVSRYGPIDPEQVAPLIDAATRSRGMHGVFGALAGLGVAGLALLGVESVLPAMAAGGIAAATASFLTRRRSFALAYDSDDVGQRAFLHQLGVAASALRTTATLGTLRTSPGVATPAPPTAVVVTSTDDCPLPFTLNLSAPCWQVQGTALVFLPDRLSLVTGGKTALVGYDRLHLAHDVEEVLEGGAVPSDATVLGTQWRYTTRAGGPDRRYRDNPALHLVRYGRLHLQVGGAFALTVRTSRLAAAAEVCAALQYVVQTHPSIRNVRASHPPSLPPAIASAGALSFQPPQTPILASPQPPPWQSLSSAPPQPSPPPAPPRPSPSSAAPDIQATAPSSPAPAVPLRSQVSTLAMPTTAPALTPPIVPPAPPARSAPLAQVAPQQVTQATFAAERAPSSASFQTLLEFPVDVRHRPDVIDFAAVDEEPPVVAPPVSAPTFALPPPAPSVRVQERARWISPRESVEVHGRTIRGGLVYVGEHLAGRNGQSEPSLLRRSLPITQPLDWEGASIGYWPSYATLDREQRATYLEWLSRGRRDPRVGIGYVFIFFYGLERRAFADPDRTDEDLVLLREEVVALREVYGHNRSFAGYSSSFLDAIDLRACVARRTQPAPVEFVGEELPLWLRVELSRRAHEAVPLDAAWAIAWHDAARPKASPTARARCDVEVRALFETLYRERFGAGLVPARGRARLKGEYLPASNALERPITLTVDGLTDVTRGAAAGRNLDAIGETLQRCVDELDAYSRWLGRNPEGRGSVAALAHLPPSLVAAGHGDARGELIRELEGLLGERPRVVLRGRDLIERLQVSKGAKLGKAEAMTAIQLLERLGFGVEPDLRFRGPALTHDGNVVLFRLPPSSPSAPGPAYEAATLFAQLAAVMATADGSIGEDERRHAEVHIEQALGLEEGERARIAAHLDLLLLAPPAAASIKKRLANVPENARQSLAAFLVGVAGADGHIAPAEIKLLQKLYPLLGFAEDLVFKHLHAMAAAEPSTPRPQGGGRRSSSPPAPRTAAQRGGVELDMARVQATLAQTNAVTALLGSIFAEPGAAETPSPQAPPTSQRSVAGLDAAHSGLLLVLARAPSWTRGELEAEAARWGLMPDGALEVINERAFDRCGSALCEGDDPIVLDEQIAKEMIDA